MSQKISTNLFRSYQRISNNSKKQDISTIRKSTWFARGKSHSKYLLQDINIRKFLEQSLKNSGYVESIIKRYVRKVEIDIHTTKPGLIIGKQGSTINKLCQDIVKKFSLTEDLKLNIEEYPDPNKSATVIANEISFALSKNVPYRRVAKNFLDRVKYSGGVQGIKIVLKGRLNKAEIARREVFAFGSIPRHTIDSIIDYRHVHCHTSAGIIGVKVFLYKGNKISNYSVK